MGEAEARGLSRAAPERGFSIAPGPRLNSWKEVARYFQRDERTVKRWEASRGLPIHRLPGGGRSKVYALASELDAWLVRAPGDARPEAGAAVELPTMPAEPLVKASAGRVWPPRWRLAAAGLARAAALGVAAVLGLTLHPWAQGGATQAIGSRDPQAIDLVREGQHAWSTRTAAGLAQAKDRFTEAIVADPSFARAYSGLAKTLLLEREYASLPDDEAFPQALAAARRAAEIDPGLAEAHSALGFVDFYWLWRPAEAERQFRTAIRLDGRDVTARIWFAGMLRLQRKYAQGLAEVAEAQALAPESTQVLITKAMLQVEAGQTQAGDRLLADIELAEPGQMWAHWMRARDSLLQDHLPEYVHEMQETLALRPSAAGTQIVDAAIRGLSQGGRESMLKAELQAELALSAAGRLGPYEVAGTYALLGDPDRSTLWLRRAVAAHQLLVLGSLSDPVLADLRAHRRLDFLADIILRGPGAGAR